MWLTARAERISAAIGSLRLSVCLVFVQAFVNAREADKFKESTAVWARLITSVCLDGAIVGWACSEEVVVKSVTILQTKNERYDGVVEEMLADMGAVKNERNVVLLKLLRRADTREHQKLWGLEGAFRDNDFVLGGQGELLTCGWVDDNDTAADLGSGVDDKILGVDLAKNRDIGLAGEVQKASLALALVDSVHAVSQPSHFTRVDILSKRSSLAGPCFGKGVAVWLDFGDQIRMSDLDGTASSHFGELSWIELLVIMVGSTLRLLIR
jgi:hypothetical protein